MVMLCPWAFVDFSIENQPIGMAGGYRVIGMKWSFKLNKELHGNCDAVDSRFYWTI